MSGVSGWAAFGAGLLSFLSPCVFPLIPSYLGFLAEAGTRPPRPPGPPLPLFRRLAPALCFVLGLSAIFLVLGAGSSALGALVFRYRATVTRVGGLGLVLFGLHTLGVLRWRILQRDTRPHPHTPPRTLVGAVGVGLAFGAGWSPCIGPLLGAILTYNLSAGDPLGGLRLLSAYAGGFSLPFLAAALLADRWLRVTRRLGPWLGRVHQAGGLILVATGLMMLTGYFTQWGTRLGQWTPELLRAHL